MNLKRNKNKNTLMKFASPLPVVVLLLTLILSITCKQPFSLVEELDGTEGIVLEISPKTSQLVLLDTMTLQVVGGVPPYSFSITGGDGSIGADTGFFTAPALTGTTEIQVEDNAGRTDSATITIISGGGPEPLTISPATISLPVGNNLTFIASGGETPYTFSMQTPSGTVDAAGAYLAASIPGTDVVRVTDNAGTTKDATVTVTALTSNVDYAVTAVTDTSPTTVGGDPLSGSFTLTNSGSSDGTQSVEWFVYVSLGNTVLTSDDILVDMGTETPLDSTDSVVVSFTGGWPTTAGSYYIIVKTIATYDITNTANNIDVSSAVTVTAAPAADVDYHFSFLPGGGSSALTADAISDFFTIENVGTAAGTQNVYWTVYRSDNNTLELGTDTPIDTGSIASLNAGQTSGGITFTGNWPGVAGSFYLLFSVSAGEDVNSINDISATPAAYTITYPDIDYIVNPGSITTTGNPAFGGGSISETFSIRNSGADNGSGNVFWTAYISTDTFFDDPGDTPIDSGWISSLNGGAVSAAITIDSGSWPVVASSTDYYLFINITPTDESAGNELDNNDYASFTVNVPDIDYEVTTVTNGTPLPDIGDPISETFDIQNTGGNNGSSNILWTAYISSDTVLDGSDTLCDSGQISALNSGSSQSGIGISGTWPAVAGNYYLLLSVSSTDETDNTNNTMSSGSFIISAPGFVDYVVNNVSSNFTIATTGSSLSETFDITNAGGLPGGVDVNWEAFASTDIHWDVGDLSLGTGTIPGGIPNGVTEADISINHDWPGVPATYYLIVKVDAGDESLDTNNTGYSGPFTVNNPPDYVFESVVLPLDVSGGNIGETLSAAGGAHTFRIRENAGFPGMQSISWDAYISFDTILDGSDVPLDSGTIAALGGGLSSTDITVDGTLPGSYGYYYIILQLSAGDDSNTSNNSFVSTRIYVWQNTNSESEQTNDEYLSDAKDFSLLLNHGDSVTISGIMDEDDGYDLFKIRTGTDPTITNLEVSLTWSTGQDNLDIVIYDDSGSIEDSSIAVNPNSEPATLPFVTGVESDKVYYIASNVCRNGSAGLPYTMVITVP